MALTFSTKVGDPVASTFPVAAGSYRIDNLQHGLRVAHVEFKTSGGSNSTDYSGATTGFAIQSNANKFGFRKIFWVHSAVARAFDSSATRITLMSTWDVRTGKLRFVTVNTGTEVGAGGEIVANDIISMVVVGV